MAIAKLDLDKIAKATTAVDSFVATLDALVANQTIKKDAASIVQHALIGNRAELEKAINSSPAPAAEAKKP